MEWLGECEIMKDLDSLSCMTSETPQNKIRNWNFVEPKPMIDEWYMDDDDTDLSGSGYGPSSKMTPPFTGSGRGALIQKTYQHINSQDQRDQDIQAQVRLVSRLA